LVLISNDGLPRSSLVRLDARLKVQRSDHTRTLLLPPFLHLCTLSSPIQPNSSNFHSYPPMASKFLIPFIGSSSNSTYDLTGEPKPTNQLIPVEHYTMEGVNVVWAQPLAAVSGSLANLEPIVELPGSAEPGVRPNPSRPQSAPVRQRDPSPLAMLQEQKSRGIRLHNGRLRESSAC
jgi:hypothetical protein